MQIRRFYRKKSAKPISSKAVPKLKKLTDCQFTSQQSAVDSPQQTVQKVPFRANSFAKLHVSFYSFPQTP